MITRREAIQHVAALLGGTALCGGDRIFAFTVDDEALAAAKVDRSKWSFDGDTLKLTSKSEVKSQESAKEKTKPAPSP